MTTPNAGVAPDRVPYRRPRLPGPLALARAREVRAEMGARRSNRTFSADLVCRGLIELAINIER